MNKEEILMRAKNENTLGDERERDVRKRRDALAYGAFVIVSIIILVLKYIQEQPLTDILSMMCITVGCAFIYEGIKLRKKWIAVLGILYFLAFLYFFYRFCQGLF